MLHIIKIINSYFWKSYFGPFFAFIFPLIFLGILGSLLGYNAVFSGILAIPSTAIALTSMPTAVFEFKKSILFKRIGTTRIKPWHFILSITAYYAIIMAIATLWTILFVLVFFNKNWNNGRIMMQMPNAAGGATIFYAPSLQNFLSAANWGGFFWGMFANIFVGISIGMVLLALLKSALAIQTLGTTILIVGQFLSSQVVPISMVANVQSMHYLSYIMPFKYSTGLIIESMSGKWGLKTPLYLFQLTSDMHFYYTINGNYNIFNINEPFYTYSDTSTASIQIFNKTDKILNLVIPFVIVGLFSGIAARFFKWSIR